MVEGIGGRFPLRGPQELPDPAGAARGAGAPQMPAAPAGGGLEAANESFGGTLKGFLGEANDLQLRSESLFRSFVRGEVKDLHQVVLAQQEAGIALRLVTEMRDRLLGAYQEIMRTQM